MGKDTAVAFISKWDYHKASESDVEKFEEEASDFPDADEMEEGDLKAALKHLQTVVCSPKFTVKGKGPASLATVALEWIFKGIENYGPHLEVGLQLFCVLAKNPNMEDQEKLMDHYSSFFYGLSDNKALVTKKTKLFEKYAPMLTDVILHTPAPNSLARLLNDVQEYFLTPTSAGDPSYCKLGANFVAATVTHPNVDSVNAGQRFIRENKKLFKWKDNLEGARLILTNMGNVKFKEEEDNDKTEPSNVGSAQGELIEQLGEQLKFYKVLGDVQKDILGLIQKILEDGDENKFEVAKECAEFIELKKDLSLALPLIDTFERQFKRKDYPWSHTACTGICTNVISKVMESHKDQEQFKPYAPKFVSIFKTAMNRDFYDFEEDTTTVFAIVLLGPMITLANLYRNSKNQDDLKPLLGEMVGLLQCDDEDIASIMGSAFTMLSMANPAMFAPHLDKILAIMLEKEDMTLLSVVVAGYKVNQKPVDAKFGKLWDLLESVEASYKTSVLNLLKDIAELNSKLFTKKHVDILFGECIDSQDTQGLVYMIFQTLSQSQPSLLEAYIDKLFGKMNSLQGAAMIPNIFNNIVHKNKKLTQSVFDKMIKYVKNFKGDYTYICAPMNTVRVLAAGDKEMLRPHKELFENIGEKYPIMKDTCKHLIDIIEGRSVEEITDKIEQQQEGMEIMDTRVTNTESDVKEMGQEVDSQGRKIGQLKKDVVKQEERIDELEEVVDDTVEKVEEIDKKTLSNAPAWSRDVSILLNPDAEHDWRLLAQRLGYSPEDIRGWATQHDPCMSLLSEWFATHKTSEATKAVLKNLEEMNRLDAAEIVGRAMQAVEIVVQDEPLDYETPPPIFISYQWGHQPEVRLLRKHLEMAGFESWMDVGQMGGGDKLYAKIDQGIRAAKAVICCVTEKYAKSPNCNREVNLAVNLGKPIIPLLMENVAWPPPGAMGPIFGEYLYIRFFQGGKEDETKDDRVWPPQSFQELLMQLSYMKLIPEQSKITKPYKNWWLPPEEDIVVNKKSGGKSSQTTGKFEENKNEGDQPEVFISYQWGIQPQVKGLYKRMSGLGYHCWMDIHQMGGGDSLYDKIDRGVRGSKVVVSCVTEKYSKSANCRREVSLADALKKPIIPLLLEDTTWPPSGPMSMVFTQLLYIDFKDEKIQKSWTGSSFDELLSKIKSYTSGSMAPGNGINGKQGKQPGQTAQQNTKQNDVAKGDSQEASDTKHKSADPNPESPEPSQQSQTPTADKKSKSCTVL